MDAIVFHEYSQTEAFVTDLTYDADNKSFKGSSYYIIGNENGPDYPYSEVKQGFFFEGLHSWSDDIVYIQVVSPD